ncbi:MAG TPA: glycosyltransferase family 9 protein [Pyrinomonadaceae bacterium]|nr:glycosyltransferase family 9 protein [Pyrinomonadaceae bacterium]
MAKNQRPKTKNQEQIDWQKVGRVLVIRLRSIGDTVLATSSLIALKRFLPHAEVDILLEDWVAPLLDGHDAVDNVITTSKTSNARLKTAREIRKRKYDVVFNLHGGSTSSFFVAASRAKHRVGYAGYRYSFLYNHLLSSSADFWGREKTHSAEQQLALLGHVGIPVNDKPWSRLAVTEGAAASLPQKLGAIGFDPHSKFAVIHPLAAFDSKRWAPEKFAKIIRDLSDRGINSIALGSQTERNELEKLRSLSETPMWVSADINLPETTALLSKAALFVGNDSGIAHMAAAMDVSCVVIFGSMNRDHWYPWTDTPNEMVFQPLPCQPCPGHECKEFGDPKCILSIEPEKVLSAIDRVLIQADAI